jgi:hypothetical protein
MGDWYRQIGIGAESKWHGHILARRKLKLKCRLVRSDKRDVKSLFYLDSAMNRPITPKWKLFSRSNIISSS